MASRYRKSARHRSPHAKPPGTHAADKAPLDAAFTTSLPAGTNRTEHSPGSDLNHPLDATVDFFDLFDRAPVGYLLLDESLRIETINRTGAAILGWEAAWLAGKSFARWVVDDDKPAFEAHLKKARDSDAVVTQTLRIKNRHGRTMSLRLEGLLALGTTNSAAIYRIAMIDVSDDQKTSLHDRRLASEINEVARMNTAGELASSLAHELNQPLGTIVLNCQTALRLLKSRAARISELTEALTQASEAAAFASGIVRNLRGFLRRDNDYQVIYTLSGLVRDVSKLIESDSRDINAELQLQIDAHLPSVRINTVQIQQVMLNLAHNSIEAMRNDNGPHKLVIRGRQECPNELLVSVIDTGPGFTARQRALMFTPRYTTKPNGMGLGLSISRTIIEAHGGHLWADPESTTGAVMHFTLPTVECERHVQ